MDRLLLTTQLERLNIVLFQKMHATLSSAPALVSLAAWLSELPLFAAGVISAIAILHRKDWASAIRLFLACGCVVLTELALSTHAYHPRPFAAGFGPAWVYHAANNSLPSTHAALIWAVATVFALKRRGHIAGTLYVLGGVIAWARIYVGIHWPADMLAAAISALAAAVIAHGVYPKLSTSLRRLFARSTPKT